MKDVIALQPENILRKLATGLSLLPLPVRGIPDILELGLRDLQALSITTQKQPLPANRYELFEMLERPMKEWWPGKLPSSNGDESLLFMGQPTPYCMDWAVDRSGLANQLAEVDEVVMEQILELCRTAPASFYQMYVTTRRFLIEHPVVSQREIVAQISSGTLHNKAQDAYEVLPSECVNPDGFCYLCDHCGDALIWRDGDAYCRSWKICEKAGKYSLTRRAKVTSGLMRIKRGMMFYVVLPGLPELSLQKKVEKMGLPATLWPGVDQYDLRVVLPDQSRWVVDIKATRAPKALGEREADKGFIPLQDDPDLGWDRAFYAIPDLYFYQDFAEQFCRGANVTLRKLANNNIGIMSISAFLNELREKTKDASS